MAHTVFCNRLAKREEKRSNNTMTQSMTRVGTSTRSSEIVSLTSTMFMATPSYSAWVTQYSSRREHRTRSATSTTVSRLRRTLCLRNTFTTVSGWRKSSDIYLRVIQTTRISSRYNTVMGNKRIRKCLKATNVSDRKLKLKLNIKKNNSLRTNR